MAALVVIMAGYLAVDQWWPSGRGNLVVTSDPPGAQVWLDLKPTDAITNGRVSLVPTGKHSVMVKLDTLESDPVAQVVEIRRGKTDTVRFRLSAPEAWDHKTVAEASPTDQLPEIPPIGGPVGVKPPLPAELLRPAQHRDSITKEQPDHIPQSRSPSSEAVEPPTATGVLEVAASVPGAKVFLNDKEQPQTTPASLKLPAGTYTVRVELAGYTSEPSDQTVSVLRSSALQSVYFTLTAEAPASELSVVTAPFAGQILINSIPAGEGKVKLPRDLGSYTVSFGDSPGWKTPDPVQVSLTPTQPVQSVKGVYTKLFNAAVEVDGGKPASPAGGVRWQIGAYFEDEGAHPSPSLGPRIRPIPGSSKSGWEMAEGDPNRNPMGGDYIEFTFALPPEADPKSPLNLRLYLYRSTTRYAFSLTGRSEVVVLVNGHTFLDGYRPQYGTDAADEGRYEEWSLQGTLVKGENHILIRSGEHNSLFNYLWKIEIL